MEMNYGIGTGVNIQPQNDIWAHRHDPALVELLAVTASPGFEIKRGQILRKSTGQTYVAVTDKAQIEDDSLLAVVLNDFTVQASGVAKVACIASAQLIQQRLIPNDIPTGLYNFGNIIIKKEVSL